MAAGVWMVSKLVAPQLWHTSFSWKGVMGYLAPLFYTSCRRKNHASCIIYYIALSSLSAEAAAMEVMWRRTWTGTGLTLLIGDPAWIRPCIGTSDGCPAPPHYLDAGNWPSLQRAPGQWIRGHPPPCGSKCSYRWRCCLHGSTQWRRRRGLIWGPCRTVVVGQGTCWQRSWTIFVHWVSAEADLEA